MQVNWDEPRAFDYRASDEEGRVVGRAERIVPTFEYTASVRGHGLGTYISADAAKTAVERALRGGKEKE